MVISSEEKKGRRVGGIERKQSLLGTYNLMIRISQIEKTGCSKRDLGAEVGIP